MDQTPLMSSQVEISLSLFHISTYLLSASLILSSFQFLRHLFVTQFCLLDPFSVNPFSESRCTETTVLVLALAMDFSACFC